MANNTYGPGFTVETVPEKVDKYRFSMTITTPYPEKPLTLFVLMMNPSIADSEHKDPTVDKIIKHQAKNYKKIIIVNTTPIIETDSSKLKEYKSTVNKLMMTNKTSIGRMIKEAHKFHFWIATGNTKKNVNDAAYEDLMNYIDAHTTGNGQYAMKVTAEGYGKHPSRATVEELEHLKHVVKADDKWHIALG